MTDVTILQNGQPGQIPADNFNVTCVGDQNPEDTSLYSFPNNGVGAISEPFNEIVAPPIPQQDSFSVGDISWLAAAMIGYDQLISPDFLVGAFADVSITDANTSFALTGPIASISGQVDIDLLATVGGRLGWIVPSKNGLLYVFAGYTYADAGSSGATVTTAEDTTTAKFSDFEGYSVGGGGEAQLGGGWFARLEYRYTNLNSEKFSFSHSASNTVDGGIYGVCAGPSGPSGVDCLRKTTTESTTSGSAEIDPDIHSVRMAIGYKF